MTDFDNVTTHDPFADDSIKVATSQKVESSGLSYDPFKEDNLGFHANSSLARNLGQSGIAQTHDYQPTSSPTNSPSPSNSLFQKQQLQQQQNLNHAQNNDVHSSTPSPTAAELQKRQEELDKRALELKEREEALQKVFRTSVTESTSNFPPLPRLCPIKPCFYQDIEAEIPVQFQRLVNMLYFFWLGYIVLLLWNLIMCLAYFVVTVECSLRNHSAVNFTLSLLNLIIFTPASYVFWFRPVYRAFKYDSSINFFVFFFVFFMQFITLVMQCLALDGWGFVGILNSMDMFTAGYSSASIAGVFMFLTGVVFGFMCIINMILLLKVHQIYRNSGGSLEKAQLEFNSNMKDLAVNQDNASQSLLRK